MSSSGLLQAYDDDEKAFRWICIRQHKWKRILDDFISTELYEVDAVSICNNAVQFVRKSGRVSHNKVVGE